MKNSKHQLGMSLVEVLVAMVISLFLLAGIVQVYLANKSSYRFTNAISRIQENGRFAMETMARDLRMVGFFGCAAYDPDGTSNIVNNLNPDGASYDPAVHNFLGAGLIQGTDNGANISDSITIHGAKPGALNVLSPFATNTSAQIITSASVTIEAGDIVMVSNCKGADIFEVSNINPGTAAANTNSLVHNTGGSSPGNFNPDSCPSGHCFSQIYGAEATVVEMQSVTYTVGVGASNEPALFRSENGGVADELVDGIEQMQILYGIDINSDGHPNQYIISTDVDDMNDVVAVRLMLLVRSENDGVTEGLQKYTFNSINETAPDNRLRQVFTSTITLRNRIGDT